MVILGSLCERPSLAKRGSFEQNEGRPVKPGEMTVEAIGELFAIEAVCAAKGVQIQ